MPRIALLLLLTIASVTAHAVSGEQLATRRPLADDPTPEQLEFFERKVRPLLRESCLECHGEEKSEGGLRLDSRAAILMGGDRGPAIELGAPDESLLMEAVSYDEEDMAMPPEGKLDDEQIEALKQWIEWLAPWPTQKAPSQGAPTNRPARAESEDRRN